MTEICETPLQLVQYFSGSSALSTMCSLNLSTAAEPVSTTPIFYLEIFLLTVLLEAAFYFAALRKLSLKSKLQALFVANIATHPAVCFAFPYVSAKLGLSHATDLASAEIFAPVVEALILIVVWKIPKAQAFTYMIAANLFSWWLGLILYTYIAPYILV